MLGENMDKDMIACTKETLQQHIASIILTTYTLTSKLGFKINEMLAYDLAGESIDTMINIEKKKGEYYEYTGD